MRRRSIRLLNRILAIIAFILGFTSTVAAQYGVMTVDYKILGNIKAKESQSEIPQIKLTLINENNNQYRQDDSIITYSDNNGKFEFHKTDHGLGTPGFKSKIIAEDIDKEKNGGEFHKTEIIVDEIEKINVGGLHYKFGNKELITIYMNSDNPKHERKRNKALNKQIISDNNIDTTSESSNKEIVNNISARDIIKENLVIYPNPNEGIFHLRYFSDVEQNIKIRLLAANGSMLYSEKMYATIGQNEKRLSLENYSKGIYFLQLSAGKNILTKQIVKQ